MRSRYEAKTQKELERQGYVVDYKCRPYRVPRGYKVDTFGLFDILAYRDGELVCIAVKGHEGVPGKLRKGIEEFTVSKVTREIWVYQKNGKVKKERI